LVAEGRGGRVGESGAEGSGVDLQVLRPLEVRAAGGPLALGGVQQRAVLAMLALHLNEVVSTDALVDGLWREQAPASALNIVQGYISRLRKTLQAEPGRPGGAVLLRRGPGYLLELDPELVDLYRFQRLLREGREALRPAPARAASILREALGLWRGQPLAEFTEVPFAQAEIPRLEQQRLAALEARLQADLALGRHAELIGELQALVAEHPLHEGLHRLLMLSLYRSGRQAEALEAYRRARHTLSEELGIDPGRALQELEAAILTQDPSLDWTPPSPEPTPQASATAEHATTPVPAPQVWNAPAGNPRFTGRDGMPTLPASRVRPPIGAGPAGRHGGDGGEEGSNPVSVVPTGAPLVGREDELRRLAEVLQGVIAQRHPAVVLVTGEGGVGKSRLLQEAVAVARGRGVLTLHGTAGPLQRDLSYAPLVEALRPLLRGTGPSGRARIEALVEGLSDLARLFDGLPLVPPPPLSDRGWSAPACSRPSRGCSTARPEDNPSCWSSTTCTGPIRRRWGSCTTPFAA
jgi:DNA-binding SARP family transcriptional activator